MVSVTSASRYKTSRYISSASRYHPRYQRRSLMYIRGLIPWNFAELTEAVPIVNSDMNVTEALLNNNESARTSCLRVFSQA